MIKAGNPFGQNGPDFIKRRAGRLARRELIVPAAFPAGTFDKITNLKIKFISVRNYFIHI